MKGVEVGKGRKGGYCRLGGRKRGNIVYWEECGRRRKREVTCRVRGRRLNFHFPV